MKLERSRTALQQATEAVEDLRAVQYDRYRFERVLVETLTMVRSVGSVIYGESKESKPNQTPEFKKWWKETQKVPLFQFMDGVRNIELKERRRTRRFVQFASGTIGQQIAISTTAQVLDKDGNVVDDSERPSPPLEPPTPEPQRTPTDPPPQWEFVGEGEFDGHEVFALLDRYIAWMRDDILPRAERLTK